MPSLICDVKNCSYNEENYCCLSAIHVGEHEATNNIETCCESFSQDAYIASNCVKEKEPQVAISCKAVNCIHNTGRVCAAESVNITSTTTACCSLEDTLCGAFVCK